MFERKIRQKLKEAELEAQSTSKRVDHDEVMKKMRKLVNESQSSRNKNSSTTY